MHMYLQKKEDLVCLQYALYTIAWVENTSMKIL